MALIFDIKRYAIHDGPGIRTTLFLKGCPLRCVWCHNPESLAYRPEVGFYREKCVACGTCASVCPESAIRMKDGIPETERSRCTGCFACADACPADARTGYGALREVGELAGKLLQDRAFFENSGGGVTISGGEPLCQIDFVVEVLQGLKANGIHTALDTTGFAPWETVERTTPYVDLYLYDLKHMDSAKHKATVAVPNERIKENAQKLAQAGKKLQVRIPVIPRFNEDEENIRATAEFCVGLGDAVEVVQLLPYHNMGVMKYLRISDGKPLEATPPSDEKMAHLRDIMASYGLNVTIH